MGLRRCGIHRCGFCSHRQTGARQVDPHVFERMRNASLAGYRKALGAWLMFLAFYNVVPDSPEMADDFLLEWKADSPWVGLVPGAKMPSKSQFQTAIAAVGKAVPAWKGKLPAAKEALNS